MPRVIMLTSVSSLAGAFHRGQAADLGEVLAAAWIKAGWCRLSQEPAPDAPVQAPKRAPRVRANQPQQQSLP